MEKTHTCNFGGLNERNNKKQCNAKLGDMVPMAKHPYKTIISSYGVKKR